MSTQTQEQPKETPEINHQKTYKLFIKLAYNLQRELDPKIQDQIFREGVSKLEKSYNSESNKALRK